MGMIQHGRLPVSQAESDAVDDLIGRHPRVAETWREPSDGSLRARYDQGIGVSLARRDPGEQGPLLVHFHGPDLDETYQVNEHGQASRYQRGDG